MRPIPPRIDHEIFLFGNPQVFPWWLLSVIVYAFFEFTPEEVRSDLNAVSFKVTAFFTSCLFLNFNNLIMKQHWENIVGATEMFTLVYVFFIVF